MFGFKKQQEHVEHLTSLNDTSKPSSLEQQLCEKVVELDARCKILEEAIIEMCHHIKTHLERIDENTLQLDNNMHQLAALAIQKPKDMLDGSEHNPN